MQIQVNYAGMDPSDAITAHVEREVNSALARFEDRITRVEAHLRDSNGLKGGPADKQCTLEARPAGIQPVVVDEQGDDLYAAVGDAASKLRRALAKRFDRLDEPHR